MELTLEPIIPMTRVINGHNSFNRGYIHPIRGKSYEEYYGEEIGRKKRMNISQKMKGHKYVPHRASDKSCVAIYDGKIVARFDSIIDAARTMGINYSTVRKYIKGKLHPKNQWKWFIENESYKWASLIQQ